MPIERLAIVEWLWRSLKVTETAAVPYVSYHFLPVVCTYQRLDLAPTARNCYFYQVSFVTCISSTCRPTCGTTVLSNITSSAPFPSFCRPQDISVLGLPNVTESLKVFSRPIWAIRCSQMALPISITVSLLLATYIHTYIFVYYKLSNATIHESRNS